MWWRWGEGSGAEGSGAEGSGAEGSGAEGGGRAEGAVDTHFSERTGAVFSAGHIVLWACARGCGGGGVCAE